MYFCRRADYIESCLAPNHDHRDLSAMSPLDQSSLPRARRSLAALLRTRFAEPPDVEVRQIQMAFMATPKNLCLGMVAGVLLAYGVWAIADKATDRAPLHYLLLWTGMLMLILARGMLLAAEYRRAPKDDATILRYGRRLANNAAVAGAFWGISSLLVLDSTNARQTAFVMCSIALVVMGGASAQAQYRRLVTSFVTATTITFFCGILASPMHPLMGIFFLLFAAAALVSAQQQHAAVKTIIELNIENERLLDQARETLRQLEAANTVAENANRAKSRFLAATSHDLRQPMHALSLYVSHLRRCREPREFTETLDMADAAMAAMNDLLDAVLDLSRLSLGVTKPRLQDVDLDDILQRTRIQLQPHADAKRLRLTITPCRARICTDPVLLERIFRNIILNAIRYTANGSIIVAAKRRQAHIVVRIADSGIGIPKAEQGNVYQEFYQVDNLERDRQKGLGLGLAIVAQLAVLLSHPVSFRSRVGRGTIFRIVLDLATHERADRPVVDEPAGIDLVSGCSVLLLDDDPMVLDSTRRILQDMDCHVLTAGSTVEALRLLGGDAGAPDIIVSDYRLKDGETGIDAIRTLRRHLQDSDDPLPGLPGLIISGDTTPACMAEVLQAGFAMLQKPVAPLVLRQKINMLLADYSARLLAAPDRKA